MKVVQENTRRTSNDCFKVFLRERVKFDYPLHQHDDMEISLILNATGAQRIVGDHISDIQDNELLCVGSNVVHGWYTHNCTNSDIKEITLQFPKDLINERYLNSTQLINVRNLFENSKRGILFPQPIVHNMSKRILELSKKTGFDAIIELFAIINELSTSRNVKLLSNSPSVTKTHHDASRRLERVFELMNNNYSKPITLAQAAEVTNMSESAFSRFIKTHTGYSFIDNLNQIRLGHVSRMLIDNKNLSIAEIAFMCGFNNIAHFNRTFKNKKNITPKDFRAIYAIKGIIFSP